MKFNFLQNNTRLRQGYGAAKAGFTLIETIVAIFILSMTMAGLLTLAANGFYSVRYSRNQIVADNLAQEAIEYVRNVRDTAFLTPGVLGMTWETFLQTTYAGCFDPSGCIVDIYSNGSHFIPCDGACPYMKYHENQGIYGYAYDYPFPGGVSYDTSYVRTIKMDAPAGAGYFTMNVTVRWLNGGTAKSTTQTVFFSNWRTFQ